MNYINILKSSKVSNTFTTRPINNYTELEAHSIIESLLYALTKHKVINLSIVKIQYNCVMFECPYLCLFNNSGVNEIRLYNYNGAFYEVVSVNSFIVPLRHIESEVRTFNIL